MAFAKKKIYITALGTAEPYCYLHKPDFGHGDFKTDRGKYKVDLTCDITDPKVIAMMELITEAADADYAARLEAHAENPPKVVRGKKPLEPYQGDLPFFDNGDGTVTFKFNCYASYTDKKTNEVKQLPLVVADSAGKRIKDVPAISGGSTLKLKYSLMPYGWSAATGASVKLQLEGVMLVDLVEFGGSDGGDWGDETEEGGYRASQSQSQEERSWSDEQQADDSQSDDDEDF